ncbi:hypothetical protein LEP1GSC021_4478 [Leptospira noguchii str. 1993005606]|nr:hypothetical protein LEP1GSC021_4478 [Leptospira noguchii str. 1993005606]
MVLHYLELYKRNRLELLKNSTMEMNKTISIDRFHETDTGFIF